MNNNGSESGSNPFRMATERNGDELLAERVRALTLENRPSVKRDRGSNTWLPWLLCIILAGAWAGIGIRGYKSGVDPIFSVQKEAPSAAPATATPGTSAPQSSNPMPTAPAAEAPVPEGQSVLVAKGYIIPAHQISVSPVDVVGRLVELNIEEGKHFQQGQVLAVIDSTSYQADFDESLAQYNAAKARYEEIENGPRDEEVKQIRADLDEAKAVSKQYFLEYERNKGLRNTGVAQRDFEVAESNYQMGLARIRKLEQQLALLWPRRERKEQSLAELKAAEARVNRAKFRLDNCQIRAPVSGTILSKKAEIGNLINPVVGGLSTSLCDMADLADLEVDLEIQERDISKLFIGQACEIRADAFPGRKYNGKVDRIMPIANRARGILPVRVKIFVPKDEEGKYLKPEMGAVVTFLNSKVK